MINKLFLKVCMAGLIAITIWQGDYLTADEKSPVMMTDSKPCGLEFSPECTLEFIEKVKIMRNRSEYFKTRDGVIPKLEQTIDNRDKPWTVMLYVCADQNIFDIFDMFREEFTSGPNLDVLVLKDTPDTTTQLFYIEPDHSATLLEDWGELSMSDYETLRELLITGQTAYSADRYMLLVYGHGGAWLGAGGEDQPHFSMLPMDGFKQAIIESGIHLDMLMFTAPCLMGNLEAAYQLRDHVDVYVASPESSYYMLWYGVMDDVRGMLNDTPSMPLYDMAEAIIQWTYENNQGSGGYEEYMTMSAIRCGLLEQVGTSMNNLSHMMRDKLEFEYPHIYSARAATEMYGILDEDYWSLVDVYDFIEKYSETTEDSEIISMLTAVMTDLDQAILAEWHGAAQSGGHGLSIYMPHVGSIFMHEYENSSLDFVGNTEWDEFLKDYGTLYTPTPTPYYTPPVSTPLPELPLEKTASGSGNLESSFHTSFSDINGDGMPDLLSSVYSTESGTVQVYLNRSGWFEETPYFQIPSVPDICACRHLAADLAGDGFPDILVILYNPLEYTYSTCLYSNVDGMPDEQPCWSIPFSWVTDMSVGDVDGDSAPDLLLSRYGEPNCIFLGLGDGRFQDQPFWESGDAQINQRCELVDINADGYDDVAINAPFRGIYIYMNDGGTIETTPSWELNPNDAQWVETMVFGDYDLDGFPEMAVGRYYYHSFLIENENGRLTDKAWQGEEGLMCQDLAWGDLNGDGYPELCAAAGTNHWGEGGETIYGEAYQIVYYNDHGCLSLRPAWCSDEMTVSYGIHCLDLDGDEDNDVFIETEISEEANSFSDGYKIYFNTVSCENTGVELIMPGSCFRKGDLFGLRAEICNREETSFENACLFVLLEAYGTFWCAPSWCPLNSNLDYYTMSVPTGTTEREIIPEFEWSSMSNEGAYLTFYGALTDEHITTVIGDIDICYWSFE